LAHPDKGIHFISRDGASVFQSYSSLLQTAARIASGLQAAGLKPGDKLLLQLDQLEAHYAAFWGCLLGGFVPTTVAIAPTYTERNGVVNKLHNTWQLLERPAILTTERLCSALEGLAAWLPMSPLNVLCFEELLTSPPLSHFHAAQPEDVAFFQLSSGSTGVP